MNKFEDVVKNIVTEIVAITNDDKQALEIFLSNLYSRREAQRICFFFPSRLHLNAINTVGMVPEVGQKIYVHTLLRRGGMEEFRNYDDFRDPWIVERVDYSLTVPEDAIEALKKELWGHRSESYRAQVQLRPMTLREKKPRKTRRIRPRISRL